jgi:hypothetical protein
MTITLIRDGRVKLDAAIALPMSVPRLWGEIADLPRFAVHDFFHAHFELPQGRLEAGAPLVIRHSYLGITVHRVGRVLRYKPLVGYSFSDLSRRSKTVGFPHIFTYRIERIEQQQSRLRLEVRGRWTIMWLPRWLVRLWLWVVFLQIVTAVENELLWYCPRGTNRRFNEDSRCQRVQI